MIQKGTVQSVQNGRAIVVPALHPDMPTRPLCLPFYWQERMGNIKPGDIVFYEETDDLDGLILARTDGEWDNTFRGALAVSESVTADTVTAETDATAAGVSLKSHTHTSGQPGQPTSPPNA